MSPLDPRAARRVFAATAVVALVAALAAGLAGLRLQQIDAAAAASTPPTAARSAQAALELSGALGATKAALTDARIALTTDAFAVFRKAAVAAEGVARIMAEAQDGGAPSPAAARAATALDAASNRVDARLATVDVRDGGAESFTAAFNRLRTAVQRMNAVEVAALFAAMQGAEARFALTPTPATRQAFERIASTLLAETQNASAPAALRRETADAVAAVNRLFAQNAALRLALTTLGAETDALIDQAATAVAATAQAASAGLDAAATAPPQPRPLRDATPAFAAAVLSFALAIAAAAAAWSARGADWEETARGADWEVENDADSDDADEDDAAFDHDNPVADRVEDVAAAAPIFPHRDPAPDTAAAAPEREPELEPEQKPEPTPAPDIDQDISVEDAAALVDELNAGDQDHAVPAPRLAPEPPGAIPPPADGGPYAPIRLDATPLAPAKTVRADAARKPVVRDAVAPPRDAARDAVIARAPAADDPSQPSAPDTPAATPVPSPRPPLLKRKTGKPRTAADLAARALKRSKTPPR